MEKTRREHWEFIYENKGPDEVSWAQEVPQTSLDLIRSFGLPKSASIIDIGGGESKLVDFLLKEGFENITVLDISAKALEKAKKRLGKQSLKVNWIVSDINDFEPTNTYDLWHDRATFHFLTTPREIQDYVEKAQTAVADYLTIGNFSENGPTKCSGLEIQQYNEVLLSQEFSGAFEKLKCITKDHLTPFGNTQNFLFCSFKKIHSMIKPGMD